MTNQAANSKMIAKLMFRLLPVQIVLAAVGAVNGIVSSFFASNFVGVNAMSAVGLYGPVNMLVNSVSTMLMGGAAILCGKYMGRNEQEKMQNVFGLNLALASIISVFFIVLFLVLGIFDLTGFLSRDEAVRPLFNRYLLGQTIGVFPLMVGNQLPAFLAIENKGKRTLLASIVYIVINVFLNFIFVQVLHMEEFGLALASSLGMWVFMAVELQYYFSGQSHLRIKFRNMLWKESGQIVRVGVPGAATYGYQTIRGLLVNHMLEVVIGSVGISAFAASDNLLRIFWAIPNGMLAVSRLLISVSIGEEDRQTLTDVIRVMFRRFIPLMSLICACIIVCSVPLTRVFFRDPTQPVYSMTVWGLRILPICMPFSIVCMHFTAYAQASGKQLLVHILSVMDGVVCVAGFTAILIRAIGMNSVYIANVLNGIVCLLIIVGYSWIRRKRIPHNVDELMVIPEDFGVPESDRMDLTVRNMEEVVTIAQRVQQFCTDKGIDTRRSYLAGLAMEEMAGNIVDHGFTKDKKNHTIDVRVVYKNEDVILRIKDDCVPFDPGERRKMAEGDDIAKNIGIRMVFKIAEDVQYQNILGLNVVTMRI